MDFDFDFDFDFAMMIREGVDKLVEAEEYEEFHMQI